MQGEFARLGDTPVGADELAARKATLIGGYGRSLETTAGLAEQVGDLAVYGVDLADIGRYIERVQAVTPAQIQAVRRRRTWRSRVATWWWSAMPRSSAMRCARPIRRAGGWR